MRELERRVFLSVLDRKWREHLYEMDYLKEGIGLRAMAQRDPLVEYQREGYDMFIGMLDGLKEESVGFLFNLQVEAAPAQPASGISVTAGSAAAASATAPKPLPTQEAAARTAGTAAPTALRAKGLDDEGPSRLTYTGPDEDGKAKATRDSAADTGDGAASRRERREAARTQSKSNRAPKSKRKR